MKLIITLCLAGAALARPQQFNARRGQPGAFREEVVKTSPVRTDERNAETLEMENELREDHSYDFSFSTSNNIQREESGVSYPGAEPETGNYVQSGSFDFVHPDGSSTSLTFIADENGYQPEGDAIPVFLGRVDIQDV